MIQTGVAWLLRELSRAELGRVAAFIRRHLEEMSREALRFTSAPLPPELEQAAMGP